VSIEIDLTPVREILQLDGGDVELLAADDTSVHLRLVLESAECADCVMPRAVLEEVATKLLGITVQIDDPRGA
jgi:Fe-S cluster biogenesis protein NfuA